MVDNTEQQQVDGRLVTLRVEQQDGTETEWQIDCSDEEVEEIAAFWRKFMTQRARRREDEKWSGTLGHRPADNRLWSRVNRMVRKTTKSNPPPNTKEPTND